MKGKSLPLPRETIFIKQIRKRSIGRRGLITREGIIRIKDQSAVVIRVGGAEKQVVENDTEINKLFIVLF